MHTFTSTTFKQISASSVTKKPHNEDSFGHTYKSAWVIDGATGSGNSFRGYGSDAQWFAQMLSTQLAIHTSRDGSSLVQDVADSIAATNAQTDSVLPYESSLDLPVAALSVVKVAGETLQACSVGDCVVLAGGDSPDLRLHDERGGMLEKPLAQAITDFVSAGRGDYRDARQQYAGEFRANREKCNIAYGAAGPGFNAELAISGSIPITPGETRAVLASDGAYGLVDVFNVDTPDSFFMNSFRDGAEVVAMRAIRAAESDANIAIFPRTKPFDDVSVLTLSF